MALARLRVQIIPPPSYLAIDSFVGFYLQSPNHVVFAFMSNPPTPDYGRLKSVSACSSGIVFFLPPDRMVKLGHRPHPRIVEHLGTWKCISNSAVLKYYARGCLHQILKLDADNDTAVERLRPRRKWATQIVESLVFIHPKGVVHADLDASNSLNGERPVALCFEARHVRPREKGDEEIRKEADDLFALGSLLFDLYTGKKPYAYKEDHQVEKLYKQGTFPDSSSIPAGGVVEGCWTEKYQSAAPKILLARAPAM
ncbi:tkl protein kinase [Zalerion maritima]|uniref:Tkl protein kinase n=1 Tax=Zalerion maritima TaxID=339359 RepID=A0AAD5RTG0_9PEZI|nr:tkl protein kinase [Zalerion maritima]